MPPKKSIFRGPEAQHFQLVHRSLRDPLINDPEASDRVLKPVERSNDRGKGTTLAELDASIDKSKIRANEGEAALYGITYDDSAYDYMSHLRPVQGGFDSLLIPAPKGSGVAPGMKGAAAKGKGKARDLFVDDDVLASQNEMSLQEVYGRSENVPRELQGLQPDMDPHLRQVLEALEDDAFVDDEGLEGDGDGGWWGELVKGGEADEYQRVEYEFEEWGVDEGEKAGEDRDEVPELEEREETWEDRFKAFKQAQKNGEGQRSEGEIERSEMADTLGSMVSGMEDLMVKGGKKRRGKRGPSDASGMSMSSSSMFRTQGLRDLDARFDKVEQDYEMGDDEEEEWDDTTSMAASTISGVSRVSGMSGMSAMSSSSRASLFSNASAAPPEVSREDFDAILDDFLENYEIVGRKLRPALGGTGLTGPEKLQVLRSAVEGEGEDRDANRELVLEIERLGRGHKAPKEKREKVKVEGEEQKWDVETILSTYTNTENHPGVIGVRSAADKRRRAERAAAQQAQQAEQEEADDNDEEDDSDSGSETETEATRKTVARVKGETAAEKKARKAAVKAERANRRAEKKAHTATFGDERKKQLASHKKMVAGGRAADVAVGTRGVVSLR